MQESASQSTPQSVAESVPPTPPNPADVELPGWTPEWFVTAWEWVVAHPFLGAIAVILAALVVAKLAELVILRLVGRLAGRTQTDLDDRLLALLHRPIFLGLFFSGLALSALILDLHPTLTRVTVRFVISLAILVWLKAGFAVSRLVLTALGHLRGRFTLVEERTIPVIDIATKLVLLGGGSYALLAVWGVDPTGWLASAGVIGIAVGFAAKDTLANLFAGFFILADAPYKIGDFIVLDSGERGRVTALGVRSTRLLTRDDIEITLPNALMGNAKITNESGGPWEKERIRVRVGVAYGSDVDKVCSVLERVAVEHEGICTEPAPRVRFRSFGDSSLDFELLCWIDEPVLRGKLTHDLNMDIYKTFQREGIEIPFPQRDVHVKTLPPGLSTD